MGEYDCMAEINYLAKEVEKRKNLEVNLPKYFNQLLSIYSQYSYIRLALNYYTCHEQVIEIQEKTKEIEILKEKLDTIIKENILGEFSPEKLEKALEKVDSIRNQIIEKMKKLTIYTDAFQIYEYVLNRIEFLFNTEIQEKMKDFQYENIEEGFIKDILRYVVSDKDTANINIKITEIIGQLPIRMTRQRYFEIIQDSFFLYKEADKASLEDFIYMLRTCSMLDLEQLGEEEENKDLSEILKKLEKAEYKEVQEEDFKELQNMLEQGNHILTQRTNLYMMLEEITNDVYILLMSLPYSMKEEKEIEICRQIIEKVNEYSEEKKGIEQTDEAVFDLYMELEGKQERLYENICSGSYALDSLKEEESLLKSLMLDKIYHILQRMEQLASDSIFIELDRNTDNRKVEEEDLKKALNEFVIEMTEQFKKRSKMVNRGIMASTLSVLPVFFNNLKDVEEYITQSLRNCSDRSELIAAISLLSDIIAKEKEETLD